ncbi:hypothetical protein VTO73DRAFT_8208 [Trametes versicolor]
MADDKACDSAPAIPHISHPAPAAHSHAHTTTSASVFLAELEASLVDGGTGRTTREVVCKVVGAVPVNLKALRLEASLYRDKLEKLQGIHVAEFLGLFEGSAAGDKPYAILVTVFEGDTLNRELVEYDVDFRRRVLDALIAIHKAGTTHGDVVQHNIVRKDNGTPMFIDFDCGETPHECGYREGSIKFHAPMPMAGDVGCVELWMVTHEADVWTSSHYSYYSGQEEPGKIPVEEVLLGRENIIKYQLARGVNPKFVEDNADAVISALGDCIQRRTLFDGEVPLHQAP